jgi:hypothetical protein
VGVEHINGNVYLVDEEEGNGKLLWYSLLGVKNWKVKNSNSISTELEST